MDTHQPLIIWLNVTLIALTFIALCARVGRRVFVVGMFSWHDALITVAAISAFIFSILQIIMTKYGLGLHKWDVDPAELPQLIKLILSSNVFYFGCNWAVKHALLLFYSEITRERSHLSWIYTLHFIAFGFGCSSILASTFQCSPIRKAWHPDTPGWCANMAIFFYFNSAIMLATDLVLYVMPVVFTWHLQLQRQQRIGLNCLFALGGLVLAASAARVQAVHLFNTRDDLPWTFANAMIWSVLENHLAIIVACAPSVKVVALLVFPRVSSTFGKAASKLTPSLPSMRRFSVSRSGSRSGSRASAPFGMEDLESGRGTRQNSIGKGDKGSLRITPVSTPMPSPALISPIGSGMRRASRNFAKWFRNPTSPFSPFSSTNPFGSRQFATSDIMEGEGLVYGKGSLRALKSDADVELGHVQKDIDVDAVIQHTNTIQR